VELLLGQLELLELLGLLELLLLLLWGQEEVGEVWLQLLLLSASCFPPKQANNIGSR
jgi:hypothetical protein